MEKQHEPPIWDRYFLDLARMASTRSKDPSTRVGAIIVNKNNHPISTGYNGLPRGIDYTKDRLTRPAKYQWMEHAERNAIYNAARHGIKLEGASIYCLYLPCADCARAIIQSGIEEVIIDKDYFDQIHNRDVCIITVEMFNEAGIKYKVI